MSKIQSKGLVIVISGPSGVGKGTVTKELLSRTKNIEISISATTRNPREGEVDGREYFFLSREEFVKKIESGQFVEYACVHGNMYGTLISEVEKRIDMGVNVILEIDVQGGRAIKGKFPDCVSVFILPPSMGELSARLNGRATDDEETIKLRLDTAVTEVKCVYDYDYAVVNDNLEECVDAIKSIIQGERYRITRRKDNIEDLLNGGTIK